MKKLALIIGLFLLSALPSRATITEIQHPQTNSSTCSKTTNSCTLTVAPTGVGHFGIVMITLLSQSNTWVTGVTDNKGGVWTVPGSSGSGGCYLYNSEYGTSGCAYNLTLPAGVTSITGTWSGVLAEGAEMDFREYSYTGPSVSLDNIGSFGQPKGIVTSIPGITPILSGTNDVIVQSFASGSDEATGVTVYGNANIGNDYFGSADLLNTISTAIPTFTMCCTVTPYAVIYVAVEEATDSDVYVAQNPAGQITGADCADAISYTSVSYNIPGTTYHLCGTFAMPAGSSGAITINGSGNSLNPIIIQFEPGASATAPYWGPNGFIYANGVNYVIVNGGTNGSIKATANGTNLTYQSTPTSAIYFTNVSNGEIKNIALSNIYVHAASPNDETGTQDTWGIQWINGSNASIDNNVVHDAYGCIYYSAAASTANSNLKIFNNTAYNCNWSVATVAGGANAVLNTDLIYGNTLHDWSNWEDSSGQNSHNGISVFAEGSGAQVNGLQVYSNLVYGNVTADMAAYLNLSQAPGTITNAYVFNNIFYNVSSGSPINGYLYDSSAGAHVFNNIIVGSSESSSGGSAYVQNGTGSTVLNNIFTTCNIGFTVNGGASIAASNFNDIYNCSDVGDFLGSFESTLANWQSATHLDANSTSGNPLLNASSNPPYQETGTSSAAFRSGQNLSSYCTTVPALCTDYGGGARPSTGMWDMGAYFYGAGAPQATAPVCTPGTGTYSNTLSVSCTNPSSAPVLCYTMNGTTPATNGTTGCAVGTGLLGSAAITSTGINLRVVAGGAGFTDSNASSNTYTLAVATPTALPPAGPYGPAQSVTISTVTSGASLTYCMDTTNTCTPNTAYTGAVTVSSSGYLRAQGTLSGFASSGILSARYSIGVAPPIAVVQFNTTWTACPTTSATCSATVTPTGAGHVGILMLAANAGVHISSVSTDGNWTVPTGCQATLSSTGAGTASCAYNLSLSGGVTTESVTLNQPCPGNYCYLVFYELSSNGTFYVDATGAATDATSSTSLAGTTLSLSGSNDFIAQAFRFTAGYSTTVSNPYNQVASTNPAFARFVYATNATSGAAPTLTDNANATAVVSAIAIATEGGGTPQAGTPVCTPGTGTYGGTQSVSCTNPSSAPLLCYTTNGATPATNGASGCSNGAVVAGMISVTPTSAGTVLKVVAGGTGFQDSAVASNTYTLGNSVAGTPVCTPGTGTYNNTQSVSCTNPSSAPVLCYTTNGTTPATNGGTACTVGTALSGSVSISITGTNLKVVAGGTGFTDSNASSTTYTLAVATPTVSPVAGSYATAQSVRISTVTSGASLAYCLDTTNTCTPSTAYTGPVTVSASGYLRVQGTLSGFASSGILSAQYSIGASSSIGVVQFNTTWTACSTSSSTCSLTVGSTGSGHAGILFLVANAGVYISSVSTDGSWTVPTGCQVSLTTGATGAVSCAYNLNLSGGVTAETVTLNTSNPGSYCYLMFYELSSTGTISVDTTGTATDATSSTTLGGATLSLSGSSDFIAQAFRFTSGFSTTVSSPYNQVANNPSYARFVYATNATSGAAPTLTNNRNATAVVGAIAISSQGGDPPPQAGTPVCTPGTGTFNNTQSVSCTNPSSAPVLCYTTNGTMPATNGAKSCTVGTPLSGSVTIASTGTNLKVVAGGTGFTDSNASSTTYTLAVATPTVSPVAGSYATAQSVRISTVTSGASLTYCLDTTNTCMPVTAYTAPVTVSSSGYLRAQGTLSGFASSGILSAHYSIGASSSIGVVQFNTTWTACSTSSSTCSLPVVSTGAGHAGILMLVANPGIYISSVSTGGSWTVPTGCQASLTTGATGAVSCAYNLNLSGGVTTETVTLNTSNPGNYCYLMFYELSSTGTFFVDATGSAADATSSTTLGGATLSLSGTSDFIAQAFRFTSGFSTTVSSPYNQVAGTNPAFGRFVYATNATSGSAPTLTNNRSATAVVGAIAISSH